MISYIFNPINQFKKYNYENKTVLPIFFFTGLAFAQNVYIPDNNFKAELVANYAINTNFDSEIQLDEAVVFTGSINVINKNIDDLTGIEAFVLLSELVCTSNYLSSINLTANTNLKTLHCGQNRLTSLDISNNIRLTELYCSSNNLTSLDVSNNGRLIELDCSSNNLISLDVSNNGRLTELNCSSNNLTGLDVSNNIKLTSLLCNNNNLSLLDITTNTELTELDCSSNNLTSLNLANGNNTLISNMNATNNANLSCIQIDAAFIPPSRWHKDRGIANYSKDCTIKNRININEKQLNNSINIYPNPVSNQLHIEINNTEIKEIEVYDVFSKKVMSTDNTILNVSSLPNGLYFLNLRSTNDSIKTIKFVKK